MYRYYLRWSKKGLFERMVHRLSKRRAEQVYRIIDGSHVKVHQDACHRTEGQPDQVFGKTKGGRNTKLHALVDATGKPLKVMLLPGQEAEVRTARELLGNVRKKIVLADKGYDSDALRDEIARSRGFALIPGRKNRKREVLYVKSIGRQRHVVENFFARIKRFRRVATRYDRLASSYLGFVHLASASLWLR